MAYIAAAANSGTRQEIPVRIGCLLFGQIGSTTPRCQSTQLGSHVRHLPHRWTTVFSLSTPLNFSVRSL